MKAVNLVPQDARRPGFQVGFGAGPGVLIVAVLGIAVALVTIGVLTNNTISDRKAKLASVKAQLAAEQVLAGRLAAYQKFEQLAQARAATVRQIVATRFDWQASLSDLSKVVPSNTSLQTLAASVSTSANAGGAGGSAVRGAINAPAFDIVGCTATQDDVARLMSRLRTMNGVTRVTLETSTKVGGTQSGVSTSGGSGGCSNGAAFHLVVFFTPLSASGAATLPSTTSVSTTPPAGTATTSTSTTSTSPSTGATTSPTTGTTTTTGSGG